MKYRLAVPTNVTLYISFPADPKIPVPVTCMVDTDTRSELALFESKRTVG